MMIPVWTYALHILWISAVAFGYEKQYKKYAHHVGCNTALIVICYNRPEYLKQCIAALERNPESRVWPVIFALDGGSNAKQHENLNIIESSSLKDTIILQRPHNYGCIKNYIDAHRFAFEWCMFERVIVVEDDIVITDSYCRLMSTIHEWAEERFDNIGAVQGWSYCMLPRAEKQAYIAHIEENPLVWSFVTYSMTGNIWRKISPILYKFEAFVDKVPKSEEYDAERSCLTWGEQMPRIKKWVEKLVARKKCRKKESDAHLYSRYEDEFKDFFLSSKFNAAIDVVLGLAFYVNDLVKLCTVVNRAIHIGEQGLNTDTYTFQQRGYHNVVLDQFPEDKVLRKFCITYAY